MTRFKLHRKAPRSRMVHRRCRGATTVEFAIVVPIIFTLFMGTVEMTRLNFIRHSAANAAYEGARRAIVPGSRSSDARDEAERLLTAVGVAKGANINVATTNTTTTVTVTIPVNQNSWGIGKFSSGMNITQSCALTRESVN
jgi:Flp pilus assembly protein TadG